MPFPWQDIAVIAIVVVAMLYVARHLVRLVRRLRNRPGCECYRIKELPKNRRNGKS